MRRVSPFASIFFTLIAKMEDYIYVKKLLKLNDLLQTTGQKITRSFQTEWYTRKEWLCGCVVVRRETAFSAFPAFCSQRVTLSGLQRDFVT